MRLTPQQRREKLEMFNMAEASRVIGIDQDQFYKDVWEGRVVQPTKVFARRAYYTIREINELKSYYKKVKDN
ncbi:hypothetical protein Poly24_27260 [Rosistilla carotiformis]|uniref:Helix-turn-helix domain protein n=1 Tax=Rosistilla carotiformis TaxID=2528017 RepID=A0A518JTY5_9BACT|nr:hypothetical protein [Rosistilla carotiformis]QDV69012.1 hypothetical protein Poly24_27260 [Rosistilla carotiformis]